MALRTIRRGCLYLKTLKLTEATLLNSLSNEECLRRRFGQPVAQTHPHLLQEGEVTPGIDAAEYKSRRERLVHQISKSPCFRGDNDHVIIIPSAGLKYMTKDIPYFFKQNTDFQYFTGFLEPDSCLVLFKEKESTKTRTILFVPESDETALVWHGPCSGTRAALDLFGADEAFKNTRFANFIAELKTRSSKFSLWYDFVKPPHPDLHAVVNDLVINSFQDSMHNHRSLVDELKIRKSPAERKIMRETCSVAARSLRETIRFSSPGLRESVLEAKMSLAAQSLGADRLCFPSVVASGANANVIHYVRNDQIIKEGDLILMDTGCEFHGYCSDLTRTWPVSGVFSPAQRVLYDVVAETQAQCLQQLLPDQSLDRVHRFMQIALASNLRSAGVLKKTVPCDTEEQLVGVGRLACPHHVAHYLGMDVHDTSSLTRTRPLEPSMVVTNEPGLYFPNYSKAADLVLRDFHDIGLRIEDDVLITENKPEVLTAECPVDREQLLQLANQCR